MDLVPIIAYQTAIPRIVYHNRNKMSIIRLDFLEKYGIIPLE